MENKHKVYNLIILDESGSMQSIKKSIINGFNEVVQTIKAVALQYTEQEHTITLMSFNQLRLNTILENMPITQLNEIDEKTYLPNSNTPLFDAIGHGINNLSRIIEKENPQAYNVLVTILTDGEENASKEYNGKTIKSLIEERESKNWTFTYIGANHDVEGVASSLSIRNIMRFEANEADIQRTFLDDRNSRINYSEKIRKGENTTNDYFQTHKKTDVQPADKNEHQKKSFWKSIFKK
jgi:hypothetical protein